VDGDGLVAKFSEVGIAFANGVKSFKHIAPVLELASRRLIIVSDSDAPAKEKQREFVADRVYGEWLRYDEIVQDEGVVTC